MIVGVAVGFFIAAFTTELMWKGMGIERRQKRSRLFLRVSFLVLCLIILTLAATGNDLAQRFSLAETVREWLVGEPILLNGVALLETLALAYLFTSGLLILTLKA